MCLFFNDKNNGTIRICSYSVDRLVERENLGKKYIYILAPFLFMNEMHDYFLSTRTLLRVIRMSFRNMQRDLLAITKESQCTSLQ